MFKSIIKDAVLKKAVASNDCCCQCLNMTDLMLSYIEILTLSNSFKVN